jgi:hypothetical protein
MMTDIKTPAYVDRVAAVRQVRDSHQVVIEGIATAAEKHRVEINAKRMALRDAQTLNGEMTDGR